MAHFYTPPSISIAAGFTKPRLLLMASSSSPKHQKVSFDYRKGVKHLVDSTPSMKTLPPEFILPLEVSPLSAGRDSIPAVDLSGLDGSSERRRSTIHALHSACVEWGFFRVINHGISTSLMDEITNVVEGFFSLSVEEKSKYASDNVMDLVRYGTSLNTSVNHSPHWRDYLRHYGHPFQNSIHLWPDNPTNYRDAAKTYLEKIRELALKIGGAISEGLGLPLNYLEQSLGTGTQILAANYYPPCPEPDKTLGLAAHSDHGGLAILMQNGVDGLQVKHDGKWIAIPNVPYTFVVNIGDYLEILSNGMYKSVEHRATVNRHKARISVAVGHGPNLDTILEPASHLLGKDFEPNYQPIIYRDYMRLQQSSAIRGKTPLLSIMDSDNMTRKNLR